MDMPAEWGSLSKSHTLTDDDHRELCKPWCPSVKVPVDPALATLSLILEVGTLYTLPKSIQHVRVSPRQSLLELLVCVITRA